MFQDIENLYKDAIREHGSVLVQVALPPAGPPVVINIGKSISNMSLTIKQESGLKWQKTKNAKNLNSSLHRLIMKNDKMLK